MTDAPATFVTFRLEGLEYAFDLRDVVEVTRVLPITPVPRTAERVLGVATWRGKTLAVLGLGPSLKHRAGTPDGKGRLLVLGRPQTFAVLIGEPGRVLRAEDLARAESPGVDAGLEAPGISRVRTLAGPVHIVDPARLLGDPRTLLAEAR